MPKMTPALVGMLLLAFVVSVFTVAVAIMLVRGVPIPDWMVHTGTSTFTLLFGWVMPSPLKKGGTTPPGE